MAFTPLILAHLVTAVGALVIGAVIWCMKKGSRAHKLLGRIWAGLIVTTSLVSFGIKTSGHFSWIHILSLVAIVGVSAAVFAAMHGRIVQHRRGMMATYLSLVVAGTFAMLPERRLGGMLMQITGLN